MMKNTTDLNNLITTLSTFEEGFLPKEALETAAQLWPQLWPHVKQSMLNFNEAPSALSESESNFLFMGILLAVQQKEYQAYPLLLTLCDRDDDFDTPLSELLGDSITELLPSLFYLLSESDTQGLQQLILSSQSGCFIKKAAAQSFFAQHESGAITRQQLLDFVTLCLAHFTPLANETSENFLASLAFNCMASDLQEFQTQFLDLANKFELAPDFITPEEIEEWDTSHNESIKSGFIRSEFNVINELSQWAAYKTPEQNAADMKAMTTKIAELTGLSPEELNENYLDELLNQQSDEDILEALLANELADEFGDDEDEYADEDYDEYFPSMQEPIIPAPKVGRNDPCVCGSGKKYKKCCLQKREH